MVATFTHYEEFPGVGPEQSRQALLAATLALDGLLRDWVALVSPRDPLRPLEVVEGPGQEEGKTGWTIQATDPNADPQGRVHIWATWQLNLEAFTTVLGSSRVRTENPGAYSTLVGTSPDGTVGNSSYTATSGAPFILTVVASDRPGKEWFTATIGYGSAASSVQTLTIVREQNFGGWLLMPSTSAIAGLRAMGREGVAPFDARIMQPMLHRIVLNHIERPAFVTLVPAAAPVGLHKLPLYLLPDDIALCDGHRTANFYFRFPGIGHWVTGARGFAFQLEEANL